MDLSSKENANPTLFSIEKRTQRVSLDWTKLGSFRQEESSVVVPTDAEDKAIMRAIMDCSRSTSNGKAVSLLRKAGLVVPTYSRRKNTNNINKNYPTTTSSSSWCSDSSRPVFSLAVDDDTDNNKGTVALIDETTSPAKRQKNENDNEEKNEEDSNQINNNAINNNNNNAGGNNNESSIISAEEIFDIIRSIEDPEHPHSLEQLGVVSLEQVEISSTIANCNKLKTNKITTNNNNNNYQDKITVKFTPTIPHCSMATLIGLCLRVKLFRSLPPTKYKVDVLIEAGTHVSEKAINKQLRDKERVRAALENKHLSGVVDKCIKNGMKAAKKTVD